MERDDELPLRRLMGLAFVQLGWTPEAFWAATPGELYAALEALGGEAGNGDRRRSFAAFKRRIEEGGG